MDGLSHFEEFLVQVDHQIGAKTRKILLFNEQCAAHPGVTTALKNIKFPPHIAQAICNLWIWGLSMLSNASRESKSYRRQQQ